MSQKTVSSPVLNYIMKWLIFALMVSGLTKSILVSLDFPVPFWTVLLMVTAFYIALSICFFNRLTLITLITATFAGTSIFLRYLAVNGRLNEVLNLFKWLVDYTLGLAPFEQRYVHPSACFITLIVSLIMYLLIIKAELLVVPTIVCVGVIAAEWALGHTQILPWLWPIFLAWVMILGTRQHRRLSLHYSMPDFGIWQISTLPLALAIILTSSILLPDDTRHLKWDLLEQTVDDISDRWSDLSGFSSPRQPFRLSQTGFPSSYEELGGPVKASGDVALKVTSTLPLYLRGTILNEYTGSSWQNSIDDRRYKLNGISLENVFNQAFDWDEPMWKDINGQFKDRFFIPVTASITHVGIKTSVIFNSLRLEGITIPKSRGSFTPYYNGKGETFTSRDLSAEDSYVLHVSVPAMEDPEFLSFLESYIPFIDWHKPFSREALWDGANVEKLLYIQEHYMSIPDTVPPRVIELAHSITQGIKSPLAKALALQAYLQENYDYSLQPPYTPPDADFVDYFLFELKRGYCTYFATAMAVMGRIAGLPTRYVEGFKMPSIPYEENLYEVKNLNGHAWVEIYFPKVGWLTFDPTPQSRDHQDSIGQTQDGYPGYYWEEPYYPWMQYQQNGNYPSDAEANIGGSIGPASKDKIPWIAWAFLLAFALIVTGMIGLRIWDILRWKKISRLPFEKQLSYCYRQILWLLTLYGFPMRKGETPYSYARRVDTWLTNTAGSMMDICQLVVKNRFGNYQLTGHEMEKIRRFYHNLEENIKDLLGFYPYTFQLIKRHLFRRNSWEPNP